MAFDTFERHHEELILGFLAESGDDYTSGEALSSKLGLTAPSVWKHVEALRLKGYRIENVASRGYRLVEVPDRLTSLELSPLLSTHDLGQTVHFFESLPSTNERAFQLAQEGAEHGEVVVADQQTAGKGRRGRTWVSPPAVNLYFTAILRPDLPPQRAPELTLVAAVALAETLIEAGAAASIKWPNDVQVGGKKVGGILLELSADSEVIHFVTLGMGINLNATAADFEGELAESATSLMEARGQRVPRALFTAALWTRLEHWLDLHAEMGFAPVRTRWKELSATLGAEVLVKTDRTELRGIAEDVDVSGALLVRREDGTLERVLAGDVEQLRPRRARKAE